MGQSFRVAFNYNGGKEKTIYSNREVGGHNDFIGGKLIEHSYFGNIFMDSIAQILENNITKVAWIGDYAEEDEIKNITRGEVSYEKSYDESLHTVLNPANNFTYNGKFLINISKNEYISFDEYVANATGKWILNPISILTAIGNGRGGGDFYVEDSKIMDCVGSWAWDYLSISKVEPKGMKKLNVVFEFD